MPSSVPVLRTVDRVWKLQAPAQHGILHSGAALAPTAAIAFRSVASSMESITLAPLIGASCAYTGAATSVSVAHASALIFDLIMNPQIA